MFAMSYPEMAALSEAFIATETDARKVVAGLSDELAAWRAEPGSWSVAECIEHLATANHVYLAAMRPAAEAALQSGRRRRRAALPGLLGGWFVRSLEPPVRPRRKLRAPAVIRPKPSPPLHEAMTRFLATHDDARAFMREFADVDLAGTLFPNPFIRGLRWSLATGLHVLPAHERRHLWQAWNVRRAAEAATRKVDHA
jgi:hypothetical protein